jgi:hypothetical protein
MAADLAIKSLPVLSEKECQLWVSKVLALRPHWTRRDAQLPFYTLGLAAYLDAVKGDPLLGGQQAYHHKVLRQENNRLLHTHFAPLFERCCEALAQWSGLPAACVGEQSALPGFHIHLPHPVFSQAVASRHVDLQFKQVFGLAQPDPGQVLTLTLPVSMPSGAGLNLWPGPEPVFHPYHIGQLTLHSGLVPHQAVLHPNREPVARIMLQCHALLQGGAWVLYW